MVWFQSAWFVAGSGLEHTDLETMILTRYHLRHPAIVFHAAKIRFFTILPTAMLQVFSLCFRNAV